MFFLLKMKIYLKFLQVDSGAEVIITQICFSSSKILEFIQKCRSLKITVPVIPGLYIPRTFAELERMLSITKASLSQEVYQKFKTSQHNPVEFEGFSLQFMENLIREIQENSKEHFSCFHFFSLNNFTLIQKLTEKFNCTSFE